MGVIYRLGLAVLLAGAGACSSSSGITTAPAPPLDPKRKVAEQDCSKPVAVDQGNLRCR